MSHGLLSIASKSLIRRSLKRERETTAHARHVVLDRHGRTRRHNPSALIRQLFAPHARALYACGTFPHQSEGRLAQFHPSLHSAPCITNNVTQFYAYQLDRAPDNASTRLVPLGDIAFAVGISYPASRGIAASLCALAMFGGVLHRTVGQGKDAASDLALMLTVLIVALDDLLGAS